MAVQIQIRRDTTQNWYEINPILAKGEMGIEYLDNGKTKIKIGNGVDTYSNLEYFADTINYYDIINKPQINNIELNGNVSLIDLGIQPIGNYASYEDVVNGLALKADIDNTYSKSDIDTFFNNLLKIPAIEDQEGKYLKVLQGEIVWSDITGDIVSVDKLNEELDKKVDKIDGYSLISISELERLASVSNYDDQPIKEDLELLKEEVDTKASINSLDNYVLKNDLTDTLDEYALKSDISSKAEASDLISHISNTLNPHKVTKEQIGLGNVNNTSDINKPISIAMQTALNEKQDNLTTGYGISIENNVITNTVPNVQSDWLAEEGNAVIINKPNLATVATSGSYNDLEDKPVIPSEYVLPIASSSQLGGIKVGSGLNISETDGTLSVKNVTINYNDLEHKPSIGGITLIEGQTAEDLDLATSKATQSALNLKADKADTLAGYGITDAYTKEEVEARLSSVYKFKGSVPTIDYLPLENNVIGDVYNVEDTGANYAWDGDKWDKLSETIDLTSYALKSTSLAGYGITDAYTKEEVDVKIAEKDSLPAQADKQGTFLSTNGTSAFWSTLPESNDTTKGIVKLASVEELNEGLSESSVITVKNLSDKLLSKQNVLTAGEGISIVDDTISATINVPDNVVLSDNYVNAKLWKGTLSEYNSLPEYSDDITYIVTDDYNNAPSGTTNYEELENKPQINSIELSGNKTLEELGIQTSGDYATNEYVNTELDKKLNIITLSADTDFNSIHETGLYKVSIDANSRDTLNCPVNTSVRGDWFIDVHQQFSMDSYLKEATWQYAHFSDRPESNFNSGQYIYARNLNTYSDEQSSWTPWYQISGPGLNKPSSKYIDISSSVTNNGTYEVLYNGYIGISGGSSAADGFIGMYISSSLPIHMNANKIGDNLRLYLPVSKGQTVTFEIKNANITFARFVYENSEVPMNER